MLRIEHESREKITQDIQNIVGKYVDLHQYQLFFFGSRVQNRGNERSDIDLGIEGLEPLPGHVKVAIEEELENLRAMYKIELVDFKRVSDDFYRIAKKSIDLIN